MTKLAIEDLSIENKRVLMRVDFNVPLDEAGHVVDATRIEASLPSIKYVLAHQGALILMSHLGRPRDKPSPSLSLAPVAKVLSTLLGRPVLMAPDCIGEKVQTLVSRLKVGDVLLLENLRFHRAETHPEEDPHFAQELASFADLYVNDAFGTAHRKHSSTYTITSYFPGRAAAGFLLEKEIHFLGKILSQPDRPFLAILGGAKISSKIGVVRSLLRKVDRLLIGGGMAYTFLKARGVDVGNSPVEQDFVSLAEELLKQSGEQIVLPVDAVVSRACDEKAPSERVVFAERGIPAGYEGFDIGPKSVALFSSLLKEAKTVLWNGPVGVYELDRFAEGTRALARCISSLPLVSVVGGGDLIAALNQAGVAEKITHISTGGGATLEYLEYGTLPGIEALSDKSYTTAGKKK